MKLFADDKIDVSQMMKFIFDIVENAMWKKGANGGYQHFFSFPKISSKPFHIWVDETLCYELKD